MSRNAFEIRIETLQLARDILSEQSHLAWDHAREAAMGEKVKLKPPKTITTDEVLAEAEKLYAFVAKGKEAPASGLPGGN